jgi:hypothetical protein
MSTEAKPLLPNEVKSLPIFGVAQLTSINNKEINFAACADAVSQAKAKGIL